MSRKTWNQTEESYLNLVTSTPHYRKSHSMIHAGPTIYRHSNTHLYALKIQNLFKTYIFTIKYSDQYNLQMTTTMHKYWCIQKNPT